MEMFLYSDVQYALKEMTECHKKITNDTNISAQERKAIEDSYCRYAGWFAFRDIPIRNIDGIYKISDKDFASRIIPPDIEEILDEINRELEQIVIREKELRRIAQLKYLIELEGYIVVLKNRKHLVGSKKINFMNKDLSKTVFYENVWRD